MVTVFRTSLLIGVLSFVFSTQAYSKGMPLFFQVGSEVVTKTHELPDTEMYQMEDGSYMDIGVFHKQFTLMFIPLWCYDVQWCGYIDDETLMTLTQEEVDMIAEMESLELSATPSVPFWNSIGGKLLFLALIGGFIGYVMMKGGEDEDEQVDETGTVVPKFGPSAEEEAAPLTETPTEDHPK
jgi:hypothetical protein